MKSTALIANGHIGDPLQLLPLLKNYSRIVAVDGGLRYCKELGLTPHLILGDFDSASAALLEEYPTVLKLSFPKDKDQTDLELAIEHEFVEGASSLSLFGAWGERIDHSVTNLLLLSRYPGSIRLETEKEILFAIQGSVEISVFPGQTLSLLPVNGPARGITTKGLKWELNSGMLDYRFIGISNICLKDKVRISIREGILICCLQKQM
ncbi:MAG: thiamine diphosphokinase [Verrucomicrobiota bacterium]|nr:thiamine diphosphokinase [Verrucomicrobiota bacterium]